MKSKSQKFRAAGRRDIMISGPKIATVHPELPKRTASRAPLAISGKRTSLGDLLNKAADRFNARRCLCEFDAMCCPVHDPTGARD